MELRVTVLIDNNGCDGLLGEWGLSFHIEYGGRNFLLDTGSSDGFIKNARSLGIGMADVDIAVLSHAHYDHSSGMEDFFNSNDKAVFYMSPNCGENCYSGNLLHRHYIGLPKGVMARFSKRILKPRGVTQIAAGVWLVPHSGPCAVQVAAKSHLYVRKGWRFVPDDFSHEQSLVFETGSGLVVFNSCSHSGPEVIVSDVNDAFPGRPITAYLGGLHLFRLDDGDVRAVAAGIRSCHISRIYTGHCTGERAFGILRGELGDSVHQIYSGMTLSIA